MSNEIHPKLAAFIQSQLKKGRQTDLIRSRLLAAGWANDEVENALKVLIPAAAVKAPEIKKKKIITSEDVIVIREDGHSHMDVEKVEITQVSEKIVRPEPPKLSDKLDYYNKQIADKANIEIENNTFLFNYLNLSMKQRLTVTRAFFAIALAALLITNAIEIILYQWFEYGVH